MHRGKLSNLRRAERPSPNSDQISYYADEKFDGCVIMTGNDFPDLLHLDVLRSRPSQS